jgi:hypothetical protein
MTAPQPLGGGWVRVDQAAVWVDTTIVVDGFSPAMRLSVWRNRDTGQPAGKIEVGAVLSDGDEPDDGLEESIILRMPVPALIELRQLITNVIEQAR